MTDESQVIPLPLDGLRVLDVTHIVAGPFCSMNPGRHGAEVIKIDGRAWGNVAAATARSSTAPKGSGSVPVTWA